MGIFENTCGKIEIAVTQNVCRFSVYDCSFLTNDVKFTTINRNGANMTERIKDEEITPIKVAEFFLSKKELTPKKLQKLVYYSYAWFLALNNDDIEHIVNSLFSERPEAWVHGPVFPSLYNAYKEYGWHEVPQKKEKLAFENDDVQSLLETIWEKFGEYSADELEAMTHNEDPWKKARQNIPPTSASTNKIDDKVIFYYYNDLSQKKNA